MTGAKGRVRQERGLVDMSKTGPTKDSFLSQFPPEELSEERFDFDLGPDARCIQRMVFHRGKLVWFAMMQQARLEGEWCDVARADTCHDEAHLHLFKRGETTDLQVDRQVICMLNSIEDVERGFERACDLVTDQWEENERRWNE